MKNFFITGMLALYALGGGSSKVPVPDSNEMCKVPPCPQAIGIMQQAVEDGFKKSMLDQDVYSRVKTGNYTYGIGSNNPDFAAVRLNASMIVESACSDPAFLYYLAQILDKKAFIELLASNWDEVRQCTALDIMSQEVAEAFHDKVQLQSFNVSNASTHSKQMMQHEHYKKMKRSKRNK